MWKRRKELFKKLWWCLKINFGFGTVDEGSICWYSNKFRDVHDYPYNKGGDGDFKHFHSYNCHKCGKEYGI